MSLPQVLGRGHVIKDLAKCKQREQRHLQLTVMFSCILVYRIIAAGAGAWPRHQGPGQVRLHAHLRPPHGGARQEEGAHQGGT